MENKEITTTNVAEPKESKWLRYYLIPMLVFIIAISGLTYDLYLTNKEKDTLRDNLSKEQLLNSTCSIQRDSLTKAVNRLSVYKSLTLAMVHRDEATDLLKYKVGDFVYLKRDSSKVLVSDIIMGGANYEYYVRYKVMYKDKTTEEVAPELVY